MGAYFESAKKDGQNWSACQHKVCTRGGLYAGGSTRFFTVRFDESGGVADVDVSSVSAITEETAREYAKETCESGRERGWIGDYRYKQYLTEHGMTIVYNLRKGADHCQGQAGSL